MTLNGSVVFWRFYSLCENNQHPKKPSDKHSCVLQSLVGSPEGVVLQRPHERPRDDQLSDEVLTGKRFVLSSY